MIFHTATPAARWHGAGGGRLLDDGAPASAELYDPSTGSWAATAT